ncbi:amidohydrolase family protein [Mycobacterium malmoense]|uniref:Amidohydrolase n=1 Tax=Mycobacterium malmoense TaxID=1780 RepID=A0ABX3SS74_MYCMA|nr:amidohydrolase family protein [Mycobacterium malmoense]ORA82724.1 amidohydrolase [Mycobacterium malmoense]QZA16273.1 amidohydrolase family protein [Mycobacterium malmoense]UNB93080.1 amidohydrolase family protein [Mycobacterium malmoense]
MPERPFTDWHTHIYQPEHLGPVWTDCGTELVGRPGFGQADLTEHARVMTACGVERFLFLGLQIARIDMFVPNDYVGEYLAANRHRALGVGSVDPTQPGAAQELRRAVVEYGLHGVKLSPPYQGFHPHSDEAYEVYRAAADLGIFLMFHQASVFAPNGCNEFAYPTLLDKVAREFRDTNILVAHFGKPWMNETVELMMKNRNVFADVSTLPIKTWQMYNGLRLAIEGHVTDRLVFGSDFPSFNPREAADDFLAIADLEMPLPIPREIVEEILYDRPFDIILKQ